MVSKAQITAGHRPFLKWLGGKYRLMRHIHALLPKADCLIEPFVGSGAVFLNSDYERYILNDANIDLITLYKILQCEGMAFIQYCRQYFSGVYNTEENYYRLRTQFNASKDPHERSALFLYLNRHGFNGLCRYNAGKGEFNVPFGSYVKPYFPEKEMVYFHVKSTQVVFTSEDFSCTLKRAKPGSVVYCDPPYVPLSATANFTKYQGAGFGMEQQQMLADLARMLSAKGIPVLISNHNQAATKKLYQGAKMAVFDVRRSISCQTDNRQKVKELLALFPGN